MESVNEGSEDELPAEAVEIQDPPRPGARLRAAREEQGLDLEHVAAETRIPLRHLEKIEAGAYDELPSRTYAIGFTRTYARTVGLDDREIVAAVREELADTHSRSAAMAGGVEPGDPAKLPSRALAWFGAFAAVLLAVGMFAFYSAYFASGTGPAPLTENTAEPEASEVNAPTVAEAQQAAIDPEGKVVFTALEDGIWVRFYERGGERLFEAQMASGDTYEVPASAQDPLLNTGRPDALSITIDGREVPRLAREPITLGDTPVSAKALLERPAPTAPAAPASPGAPAQGATATPPANR